MISLILLLVPFVTSDTFPGISFNDGVDFRNQGILQTQDYSLRELEPFLTPPAFDAEQPVVNDSEQKDGVPGTPGMDYPVLETIPKTSFSCADKIPGGYYADVETHCQVFHVCNIGGAKSSFLCPSGSVFNQKYFVCDWWYDVDCENAADLYSLNDQRRQDHFRREENSNARNRDIQDVSNRQQNDGNFLSDSFDLHSAGTADGNPYRSQIQRESFRNGNKDDARKNENPRNPKNNLENVFPEKRRKNFNWEKDNIFYEDIPKRDYEVPQRDRSSNQRDDRYLSFRKDNDDNHDERIFNDKKQYKINLLKNPQEQQSRSSNYDRSSNYEGREDRKKNFHFSGSQKFDDFGDPSSSEKWQQPLDNIPRGFSLNFDETSTIGPPKVSQDDLRKKEDFSLIKSIILSADYDDFRFRRTSDSATKISENSKHKIKDTSENLQP